MDCPLPPTPGGKTHEVASIAQDPSYVFKLFELVSCRLISTVPESKVRALQSVRYKPEPERVGLVAHTS